MLDALADAGVYCVRGNGRTAALRLSFCYAPDFNNSELDIFALNCLSPHYLAFLDALSPTRTAPVWVYAIAEKPSSPAPMNGPAGWRRYGWAGRRIRNDLFRRGIN